MDSAAILFIVYAMGELCCLAFRHVVTHNCFAKVFGNCALGNAVIVTLSYHMSYHICIPDCKGAKSRCPCLVTVTNSAAGLSASACSYQV